MSITSHCTEQNTKFTQINVKILFQGDNNNGITIEKKKEELFQRQTARTVHVLFECIDRGVENGSCSPYTVVCGTEE